MRRWLRKFIGWVRLILVSPAVEREREIRRYSSVTERHWEYPFVVRNITKLSKEYHIHSVLDVGCTGSYLSLILAALGYKVTGSDLNRWEVSHKNFTMVIDDIKKSNLASESFDLVAAVSTIEHVGTPRYGEKEILGGDTDAVREIYRIVRKGGFFIITVPFGNAMVNSTYGFRVYDAEAFKELTQDFTLIKQEFICPIRQVNIFEKCTEADTYNINPSDAQPGLHCTTLAVFQKLPRS